jgi:hypothetical protein
VYGVGKVIQFFGDVADLSQGLAQAHFRQEVIFDENGGYDKVEPALPEAVEILGGNDLFLPAIALVSDIPRKVEVGVDGEGLLVKVGDSSGDFAVHDKRSCIRLRLYWSFLKKNPRIPGAEGSRGILPIKDGRITSKREAKIAGERGIGHLVSTSLESLIII